MITPQRQRLLPLATALAIVPLAVFGQTSIFNDSFSDGQRTGVSNTDGLAWIAGSGGSTLVASSGQMQFINTSAGSRQFSAYFAPTDNRVELANIGDSLVLSATFSVANATNSANPTQSDFRFALLDSTTGTGTTRYTADSQDSATTNLTYGGYAIFANLGATTGSMSLRERVTSNPQKLISTTSPFSSPLASTTSQALTLGASYTVTLTMTRTATGVDLDAAWTGAGLSNYAVSYSDNAAAFTHFDTVAFGGQFALNENFTFTNLSLTYNAIPEPSTYAALAGALALGFVAWRRRRSA